jgi:hypothetical protein
LAEEWLSRGHAKKVRKIAVGDPEHGVDFAEGLEGDL